MKTVLTDIALIHGKSASRHAQSQQHVVGKICLKLCLLVFDFDNTCTINCNMPVFTPGNIKDLLFLAGAFSQPDVVQPIFIVHILASVNKPVGWLSEKINQADGKPYQYWLSHGSQLLRCAPHHVRPDFRQAADTLVGDIAEARKSVLELKSRGVARFLDLSRANKRNIEEVMSDEEEMGDGDDGQPLRHLWT